MSFSIQAVAGSGKTTTLRAIAEARPGPILYLAFNKAIVEEARQRLPSGVEVCTLHSLAYRQVVRGKMREKVRPLSPQQLVKLLGIKEKAGISAYGLGILVNRLLTQIILGKPATLSRETHALLGYHKAMQLEKELRELAIEGWRRMQDPQDAFPLTHEGYMRIWRDKGGPGLEKYSLVLLDEAQDLEPNALAPIRQYAERGGQVIAAGDPYQAIYGWRGATNAIAELGLPIIPLSQSFRFGEAIARAARKVRPGLVIRGNPEIPSEVRKWQGALPDAFIFRSRRRMYKVASQMAQYCKVKILGGLGEMPQMIRDVLALKQGKKARHPVLQGFRSYEEFAQVAPLTPELDSLRKFIEDGEPMAVLDGLERGGQGKHCLFATAHQAKGLEWDHIVLGDDFRSSSQEEMNLHYVALTRARRLCENLPSEKGGKK